MPVSSMLRRGLATVMLAAAPLGTAIAPAHAMPVPASAGAHVTAVGDGGGPSVHIVEYYSDVEPVTLVPARRPVELDIKFDLAGDRDAYTDLHFKTSHPGTASCDPLSTIGRDPAYPGMGMTCPVTLPAMKRGAAQKYWVTFTGKRAGKPFSVTASTLLYAPDLRVGIYVNDKKATGTRYRVPQNEKTVTIKYVVENRSPDTLTYVMTEGDPRHDYCSLGAIAPGASASCSYTVDREKVIASTRSYGAYAPLSLRVTIGTFTGSTGTAPKTFLIAD